MSRSRKTREPNYYGDGAKWKKEPSSTAQSKPKTQQKPQSKENPSREHYQVQEKFLTCGHPPKRKHLMREKKRKDCLSGGTESHEKEDDSKKRNRDAETIFQKILPGQWKKPTSSQQKGGPPSQTEPINAKRRCTAGKKTKRKIACSNRGKKKPLGMGGEKKACGIKPAALREKIASRGRKKAHQGKKTQGGNQPNRINVGKREKTPLFARGKRRN